MEIKGLYGTALCIPAWRMPRYRLTIRRAFGDLSLETDRLEELVESADKLVSAAKMIESRVGATEQLHGQTEDTAGTARKRRGRSEAALALDAIERLLIPSGFFSTPKTTAEVRLKIAEATGLKLQSRKVSQALGYLYNQKKLTRVGQRGNYRWLKK